MELYLLRHGIAADLGEGGVVRDADRPLTQEGWKKMREAAAGMRRLGLEFDYIFTSPYVRTRQTTEAVVEALEFDADKVITIDALAAGRPFARAVSPKADVFIEIGAYNFERALIVGHMPDLSEMASVLLSGTGAVNVEFKKGAVCAIAISGLPPRVPGALLWMMTPKQLRMIAQD
ncbi:MAG TPA: phosphohistidine phosphatase SixA [Blastocatellia bacterium]|nr:phosphohistidine phosphatase SixA [Blastocatellia bacterium]